MRTMLKSPEYLRATFVGRPMGLDRKAEVLRGYVVAQLGEFKSEGRGRFDAESLNLIVRLGNAASKGLKARFTHPDLSSDGLGKFLGRSRNFALGTATDRHGNTVQAVRADLHFDPTAHSTPSGDLSGYVMDLVESDPDALSSSLVLKPDLFIEDAKGRLRKLDDDEFPPDDQTPIWRPREVHASDIVETGDAVDSVLSAPQLAEALTADAVTPELRAALKWDNVVRLGSRMLDALFDGQPREIVEARLSAFKTRYLDNRFGEDEPVSTPRLDRYSGRLAAMAAKVAAK